MLVELDTGAQRFYNNINQPTLIINLATPSEYQYHHTILGHPQPLLDMIGTLCHCIYLFVYPAPVLESRNSSEACATVHNL